MTKRPQPWYVYLVRCSDGSVYTGITPDVSERIKKHNAGRGAAYTAQRRPVTLLYQEKLRDQGSAMRREAQIKRWKKQQKEALALSPAAPRRKRLRADLGERATKIPTLVKERRGLE